MVEVAGGGGDGRLDSPDRCWRRRCLYCNLGSDWMIQSHQRNRMRAKDGIVYRRLVSCIQGKKLSTAFAIRSPRPL